MKRTDLRKKIIPSKIANIDENQSMDNREFDTEDLFYINSYDEIYDVERTEEGTRVSATDYAKMNNADINSEYRTLTGKNTTPVWLRTEYVSPCIDIISTNGKWDTAIAYEMGISICPSLKYNMPEDISELDIREVRDEKGHIIYHTLQIGEYPKTEAEEELSGILESLYNEGKIKKGLNPTGRWYSANGQKENYMSYAGKHNPEFEYNGERYARTIQYCNDDEYYYSIDKIPAKTGQIKWTKVEPISFIIKNWDEMPIYINSKGNGKAECFELRSEEAIISNIPFYPDIEDKHNVKWQNSTIRGYLNGIDVRDIKSNGNIKYSANYGGDFSDGCNFINEAFNLSREPIIEYAIPESETEIPDDAFNGCVTLKKLTLHSDIQHIGKRAFKGIDFKYVYKNEIGELIFLQELQKEKEHLKVVEIRKMLKNFEGFDYNILLEEDILSEMKELLDVLDKNNFSIPYSYGEAICKIGKAKSLCDNSDFRFFKNEIPNINEKLLEFPEEERVNFFKFAEAIRLFFI